MSIRKYGTSEDEVIARESQESREIVAKIMDIHPSQRQLYFILSDLAMNLENNDHMRRLATLIKELSEDRVDNISPLSI